MTAKRESSVSSEFDFDWLSSNLWIFKLCKNLLGYATIIVPIWLLIHFSNKRGYFLKENAKNTCYRLLRVFVFGRSNEAGALPAAHSFARLVGTNEESLTKLRRHCLLLFCFVGLQLSYLTWGILQEKIMTRSYVNGDSVVATLRTANKLLIARGGNQSIFGGDKSIIATSAAVDAGRFRNSQFLVLVNRAFAFVLACAYLFVCRAREPPHRAPLYKYLYASFSNIMSSWFQYEALKFISFPTQVLGKASKTIPVMLMGRCVSRKTYPCHEYVTAGLISAGVGVFLLLAPNTEDSPKLRRHAARMVTSTTFSGVLLMTGYLVFDSFTSNWQGFLFKTYQMSSMQMMAGVNFFSILLTLISELEQNAIWQSVEFCLAHSAFAFDLLLVSVSSAIGQIFIFVTIARFGPVTFTIIMTIRQGLAILLSCLIFGHNIGLGGIFGVILVFIALFLRTYLGSKG